MSDPTHAPNCPCHSCHTQRNPRALAPASGTASFAPCVLPEPPGPWDTQVGVFAILPPPKGQPPAKEFGADLAHAAICTCRPCQSTKPDPLYPRHAHPVRDELSDGTDAEMDQLRSERDEARRLGMADAEKKWVLLDEVNTAQAALSVARLRVAELEARIELAAPHLAVHCDCESWVECGREVSDILKGVR